jgi:hypothetical protein
LRQEVDLVAVKKKETVLVQINHWNEGILRKAQIGALHKAALVKKASSAMLLTFADYPEDVASFAKIKEVVIVTVSLLLSMSEEASGLKAKH